MPSETYSEARIATIIEEVKSPVDPLKKARTPSRFRIAASGTKTSLFKRSA
jgi:hypothetical protein